MRARQRSCSAASFVGRAGVGLLVLGLAGALPVGSALGDDLNPPPWPRAGAANFSTSAEWDFLPPQDPADLQPDGDSVPLIKGDSEPDLNAEFGPDSHPSGSIFGDMTYFPDISNGGYLGGTGTGPRGLVFNVPNWYDQEPLKLLRLQVTFSGDAPGTRVFPFIGVPGSGAGVMVEPIGRISDSDPSLPPDMLYFYEDWRILPNPDWEQVVIDVPTGTFIDQVVIDTISFPEPSSFGLLAVAGSVAAVVGTRRRRKTA